MDLPNASERKAIWDIHLSLVDQTDALEFSEKLAAESEGFSGAEIEQVVADAMFNLFEPGTPLKLTQEGLLNALRATVPLARSRADDLAKFRKWASVNARSASNPPKLTSAFHKVGTDLM